MISVSQIIESYYLIRSAYDRDEYSEVINIYQNKIHEEPSDPSIIITYGLICQIVGSSLKKMNEGDKKEDWMPILNKSLKIFKEFMESNQSTPAQKFDLQLNYANTLCLLDNPSDALKIYENIEENCKEPEVISKMNVGRSYAYYCLKQNDLGVKNADYAIKFYNEKNSSNNQKKLLAYAYNNRGLNYFEMNRVTEAKNDFSIAYELFPKPEFVSNLNNIEAREIQSLIESNKIDQAIQLLPTINDIEQLKKLYYNIGAKTLEIQNIENAKEFFSKSLELDPSFDPAKIGLAEYYRRNGEYENAKKLAEEINFNSKYILSAQNLIGSIHFDQSNYEEAIGFFKSAINSLEIPQNSHEGIDIPTLFRNYAMCLFELNRFEEGQEYLKKSDEYIDDFQKQLINGLF